MRPTLTAFVAAAAAAGFACAACVEKEPGQGTRKIDPAYVQSNILTEAPADLTNTVNADLGGKVVYLGNEVSPARLAPGVALTITHYWQVIEPPGAHWRIFSHVLGGSDGDWMNVDYSDMREGHPTAAWKAGQVIRDQQKITLNRGWKAPYAQVVVGLYRKGGQTASERMAIVSGPTDRDSRVLAARLPVGPATAPPSYVIRKATGPIEIDGVADEGDWAKVVETAAFEPTEGGEPLTQPTTAKLLWDDGHLYAFVQVTDSDVFSEFSERDGTLWKADVVELFIDADGNRLGYVELQVNPNNAQLDAWFANQRAQGGDFSFDAKMRSAVTVRGTAEARGDRDQGWDVEIAIPLAAVKGQDAAMKLAIPPALGDRWRLNIVRVDKPKGASSILASSWAAIPIQDFHALDRMRAVVFGDAEGATSAASGSVSAVVAPAAAPVAAPVAPSKRGPAVLAPVGKPTPSQAAPVRDTTTPGPKADDTQ